MTKVTRSRRKNGPERIWDYLADAGADYAPCMTLRQKEILQLLAEGQTIQQVAESLAISQRAVTFHKYEIMRDHCLKSNADIVMFALQHRMLQPPAWSALSTFN